jgi:hypothetical protein
LVAGFAEAIEREEILVAAACNHPNYLVLPFRSLPSKRAMLKKRVDHRAAIESPAFSPQ